jgi:predicted RNA-binding protein with PIN domain
MPFLIDGYNLLHAMGRLTARDGKKALAGARRSLLLKVHGGRGLDKMVTVVFDAAGAPPGAPAQETFDGIQVKFSRGETADDMIEELIRDEARPRSLTVVSDDHRIQHAARRRGCAVLGCLDYYEQLEHPRRAEEVSATEPSIKPETSSLEEKKHWLDAFQEIDDDPYMRDGY